MNSLVIIIKTDYLAAGNCIKETISQSEHSCMLSALMPGQSNLSGAFYPSISAYLS
jgi:hypothetical protein